MERNSEWYEKWKDKYYNKKIVDLKKHFNQKDFEILKKLGIEVEDKIYTEHDFEVMHMEALKYYIDDEMTPEEKELTEDLEKTGVSREDYISLLNKINEINSIYEF